MISSRNIFIFATLFFAMLMTISSAPVVDIESVTNKQEIKPIDEVVTEVIKVQETTDLQDVVTDKLLFRDATAVPMDASIKIGNFLLFKKDGEKPQFPPTQDTQSFQMTVPNDTVTEVNQPE